MQINFHYCPRKKWCYRQDRKTKWNWNMLWNGNECGKNEYDDNLKATITNTGQKQLENVQYFNHLRNMITNDARCRHEIKSRTVMAKAAFNKKKTLFTSQSDLKIS